MGCVWLYTPSMRCESNIKTLQRPSGHRPRLAAARIEGSPCGELAGVRDRSAPATPSLTFGGGLRGAGPRFSWD